LFLCVCHNTQTDGQDSDLIVIAILLELKYFTNGARDFYQMQRHSGDVNVDGRLAYVPQQPWLLNATLKDNVLFGQPYDKNRSRVT